jgi:hypothetical protein
VNDAVDDTLLGVIFMRCIRENIHTLTRPRTSYIVAISKLHWRYILQRNPLMSVSSLGVRRLSQMILQVS